jgi:hypothetical protein
MIVAPDRRASPASTAGSRTAPPPATTTLAPASNGRYSSRTWISNETVVTASIRSSALSENHRPIAAAKLATPACGITTPFGVPVDPDV